ncbi:amidase [Microbacteriaceae bacterium SG_E_30_P1]|uniref:Amidase n=1 Tax=Antiquaquibacter oligotrophicus TaxID=2880260 RepID=A0ABT6KKM6_9MICO|nr:amidase [Antiquaquibacter oligotrophicus]MDH6180526.1 amidase [Antiquaquibacter oligotrophicus]UDF13740.1 amidase [Antiquaquibacter oligotrophicus]
MSELHDLFAIEQLDALRRGTITPEELTRHYLARIAEKDAGLGAFTTVTAEHAIAHARDLERTPRAAALWGLPLAEKDLWNRAGVPTTFGSRAFADFVPEVSDEITTVLDDAGSVSLGKTATPEFGLASHTESMVSAPTRTPWAPHLGAGGSSGGAAAAVAAGLLPVAPGSDGGGSIRIPAAATGLVGLKPSRGRVPSGSGFTSLAGLVTYGALGRRVADVALILDAIAGPSPWSVGPPTWDEGPWLGAATRGEGRFQLAVMTSSPWDTSRDIHVSPEATDALTVATTHLEAIGHGLESLSLEPEPYGEHFSIIWQASAAGVPVEGERLELLEPLTRWLVERGRALSARDLAEALAWLSGYERRIIRQFAPFDAVLTPALALTPRPIGWYDAVDPVRNFDQQVEYTPWTSFVNVAGLPAIVLPVSLTADGLPMGVQLIGRPGGEDVLLALGAQLERRIGWHYRHPPGW